MTPSGTMDVVLAKQIPLTEEERREAIKLMKLAYRKYQEQQPATTEQ
ncbi:MAG: hypothetical protein GY953_57490 [bacterium]|nr:hypothetical protein [bacterium]